MPTAKGSRVDESQGSTHRAGSVRLQEALKEGNTAVMVDTLHFESMFHDAFPFVPPDS